MKRSRSSTVEEDASEGRSVKGKSEGLASPRGARLARSTRARRRVQTSEGAPHKRVGCAVRADEKEEERGEGEREREKKRKLNESAFNIAENS